MKKLLFLSSVCFVLAVPAWAQTGECEQAFTDKESFARNPVSPPANPSVSPRNTVSPPANPPVSPRNTVSPPALNPSPNRELSFTNPQDFMYAMTRGLTLRRHHSPLFEIYKNQMGYKSDDGGYTLKKVWEWLDKYPELSKLPVREQELVVPVKEVTKPANLVQFIQDFKGYSRQVRNNLLQIEANWGFWAKLLSFPGPEINPSLSKKAKQEIKARHKEDFFKYLETTALNSHVRNTIAGSSLDYRGKAIALYRSLKEIRQSFLSAGGQEQGIKNVSQALVDVVHTVGFGNKLYMEMLKSADPIENIKGIKKILFERDTLARELGFKGGFNELHSFYGSPPLPNFTNQLLSIEKTLEDEVTYTTTSVQRLRLRPLSLQESPFRSCLSGDCATGTYFDIALDPNFIYFTLTDSNHISSGHVAVVLGTAKKETKPGEKPVEVKTGFVDKIQNIPTELLIPVLEGIRLSLKEQGYTLSLSREKKNDLSNDWLIGRYVASEILPHLTTKLDDFTPHPNQYRFPIEYSNAYGWPDTLEFKLIDQWDTIEIRPLDFAPPLMLADKNLTVQDIYQSVLSLQHSNKTADLIKYLNNFLTLADIKELKFTEGRTRNILHSMIANPNLAFEVRKLALFTLIEFEAKYFKENRSKEISGVEYMRQSFEKGLKMFSAREQKIIIGEMSNWKHIAGEGYRKRFIQELSYMLFTADLNIKTLKDLFSSPHYRFILDVNATSTMNDISVLMWAMEKDYREKVQFLLADPRIDVNAVDDEGKTALMWGMMTTGSSAVKELLADPRVDVNAVDNEGKTALAHALRLNSSSVIEELLADPRIDVNAVDNEGRTALMWGMMTTGSFALKELLADPRVNVNAVDNEGQTALAHAVRFNRLTALKELLADPRVNMNAVDNEGRTALMWGVKRGSLTTEELLADPRVNVNAVDNEGQTALFHAMRLHHLVALRLLLADPRIDVNAVNNEGRTALIWGVERGSFIIKELLADPRVDVNAVDNEGQTALAHAVRLGHQKIAELLLADPRVHPPKGM